MCTSMETTYGSNQETVKKRTKERINSELVAPSKPLNQPKTAEYLATKSKTKENKTVSTVGNKIKPRR